MLLAETVQLEPPAWLVVVVLAVLLLFVLAVLAVLVLGFRFADRAGNGSRVALVLFVSIATVETLVGVFAVTRRGYRFGFLWLVPLALAAAQTFTYVQAKGEDRRGR